MEFVLIAGLFTVIAAAITWVTINRVNQATTERLNEAHKELMGTCGKQSLHITRLNNEIAALKKQQEELVAQNQRLKEQLTHDLRFRVNA